MLKRLQKSKVYLSILIPFFSIFLFTGCYNYDDETHTIEYWITCDVKADITIRYPVKGSGEHIRDAYTTNHKVITYATLSSGGHPFKPYIKVTNNSAMHVTITAEIYVNGILDRAEIGVHAPGSTLYLQGHSIMPPPEGWLD